jgi:hypothetical protein
LLYAGGLALVGRWNLPGLRLLLLPWVLASAALTAAIARRLLGARAAAIAAPAYALAVSTGPPMDFHAANPETFFLLPLLLGTWLALPRPGRAPDSGARPFWAGLCIGLATLIKQQAGVQLPVIGLFLLLGAPGVSEAVPTGLRVRLRGVVLLGAGFAAACLLALAYLASQGAVREFWYWTVEINRYYIANGNGLRDGLPILRGALTALIAFLPSLWLLALGGALALCWSSRRPQALLLLWLAASLLPIALGGRFFLHYFLQWMPPLVLLASGAAARLWDWTSGWPRARAAAALVVAAAIVVPAGRRMAVFHDPEVLSVPHAMSQARELASAIAETTPPGSRILVWGYGTALHYLSQRQPATRFPYVTYLVGAVEGTPAWWSPFHPSRPLEVPRAWDLFFEDLARHPPELVVDTAEPGYFAFYKFPIAKYPRLEQWLEQGYRRERLAGFPVWRRVR